MASKLKEAPPLRTASASGLVGLLGGIDVPETSVVTNDLQVRWLTRRARISLDIARHVAALHFGRVA